MPYLPHQPRTIDLTAIERHPPIVGSTPATGTNSAQPGSTDPSGGAAGAVLVWRSEDDTRAFAARLASHPAVARAFIELHGDLGAGKTTLARHLLRALGVQGRVKSPTYTIVEPYQVPWPPSGDTPLQIRHFDFFRFNDPREWEDAGLRDIFAAPGLKLAEWPERAAGLLPVADLVIRIEALGDESRKVTLVARTPLGRELLA